MSGVKRYDIVQFGGFGMEPYCRVEEAEMGEYVGATDYLLSEAGRLEALLERDRLYEQREALAARVGELERERAELFEQLHQWSEDRALDALKATLAQHREALAVFAKFAEALHPAERGQREDRDALLVKESTIAGEIVSRTITYGDCRRARSVWEAGNA